MHTNTRLRILVLSLGVVLAAAWLRGDDKNALDDFDERPVPVKAVAPVYPPELLRDRITGLVNVIVVIDQAGKVVEQSIAKSTDHHFERPALEAVAKWKFKPAAKAGAPVASRVVIPISFKLES